MSGVGKKFGIGKGEFGSLGRNGGERMGYGGRGLKWRVGALPHLSIGRKVIA
jgi:hypothetical protein